MTSLNLSLVNQTPEADDTNHGSVSTSQGLLILVNLLVMVFICVGNLFTILAVWRTPSLRTVPNMYVVSLAVADFLTGAIIPYYALTLYPPFQEELDKKKYLCLFRYVWFHVFVAKSISSMVAISFDRFLFIKYPLHYGSMTSPTKAGSVIAATWIISLLLGFVPLFHNNWEDGKGCYSFKILTTEYRVYGLCPAFFFCCFLTAGFYGYIVRKAIRHQRRKRERCMSQAGMSANIVRSTTSDWKSVKVFMLVFGVFFVCWVPNFTILLVGYIWTISPVVINFTVIVGFLNSGMNFIIYACQNRQFRRAFKSFVGLQRRPSVTTSLSTQ
ncbi:adenosine receptor A2a-like [Gigantopelta aegis]|uniref:adenosine receptor A2a-like n=1 Tax=Gigantopelta aegis TaxID=1735272 RepID=UPI001B8877F3|nr:adenosine receptor A2a-like [Gigantopelta aegis]